MSEQIWKYHTPQYDGHAPDDWAEGTNAECYNAYNAWVDAGPYPRWVGEVKYRYHVKQPDLLAQCLRLPQADRDALIEALQKPQRDWADDVWEEARAAYFKQTCYSEAIADAAAVIRSMCVPKHLFAEKETYSIKVDAS